MDASAWPAEGCSFFRPLRLMPSRLLELAGLFLKLGTIGFGGPAVHIGIMEKEVVQRRGWLERQQFLDLVGVTNLIPGPNSTEMAIHVGFQRAGLPGLVVAGICFILPATLITAIFAWLYVQYGSLPAVQPWFRGINPAVLAIILTALARLGKTALKSWKLVMIAAGVAAASLAGYDEVLVLLIGSLAGWIFLRLTATARTPPPALLAMVGMGTPHAASVASAATASAAGGAAAAGVSLWQLGLFFLKVGSVLYGGGYVLLAYLEGGLVEQYGWLSERELLDAVAVGQFTPGPILSTATFVGYQVAGAGGAAIATIAIFLPSFLLVALVSPLVPRLRQAKWTAELLDAVNTASIALMAVVTLQLGSATLTGWRSIVIAVGAVAVSMRWNVAPAWLVIGGAIAGFALY